LEPVVPYGKKTIIDKEFYGCKTIISVCIPSTVYSIGKKAFYHCCLLQYILIPDSVVMIGDEAFSKCEMLHTFELPNSVEKIGHFAFSYCRNLEDIRLVSSSSENICSGNSPIRISDMVERLIPADGSQKLAKLTKKISSTKAESAKKRSVLDGKPTYEPTFLPKVRFLLERELGVGIFHDCNIYLLYQFFWEEFRMNQVYVNFFLEDAYRPDLVIPDCIKFIEFYDFQQLFNIDLPKSIDYIDDFTFYNCFSLNNIDIPENVTYIGQNTFDSCQGLDIVYLPRGAEYIDENAFRNCDLSIVYMSRNTEIEPSTFALNPRLKIIYYEDEDPPPEEPQPTPEEPQPTPEEHQPNPEEPQSSPEEPQSSPVNQPVESGNPEDVVVASNLKTTDQSKLSTGAIVGIVIGSLIVVAAVAAGVLLYSRFRKQNEDKTSDDKSVEQVEDGPKDEGEETVQCTIEHDPELEPDQQNDLVWI